MKYLWTACVALLTASMLLAGPSALATAKPLPKPVPVPDTMNAAGHHGNHGQPGRNNPGQPGRDDHGQPGRDDRGWDRRNQGPDRRPDYRRGWEPGRGAWFNPFAFWARDWAWRLRVAFHPMPRLGAISGQVLDVDGYPIEQAEVVIRNETDEYRTQTQDHGFYLVNGVKPGTYSVSVLRWGYEPETYPDLISIWPSRVAKGIDFTLDFSHHREE